MVTIAIAAILMSMAVPAFRDFVQSAQVSNAANEFALSINIARTEAAKRGEIVRVGSISGTADWSGGWRVWIDDPVAGTVGAYDAGEELHISEALGTGLALDSNNGIAEYRYSPSGRVNNSDVLQLCDQRAGNTDRSLTLSTIGRLSVDTIECP